MLSLVKYLPLAIQGIAALLGVIYAITACANAILSAVPLPWREAVVKRWPRSAHLATALRSGGAHLTAFLVAMLAFLRGLPVAPPSAAEALAAVPRQPAPPNSHGFAHTSVMQGITYIVIAAALALATHGCASSQHPRSWDQNAHIAVNGATHGLRAIDTAATTRYQQLVQQVPDAQLATFETPYQRTLSGERLALDSLTTAERDINEAVAHPTQSARCVAGQSVLRARDLVTDVINLARDFGLAIDAATTATIASLEQIASALVPECGSTAP